MIGNWLSSAQDLGITELSFDFPLVGQTSISLTNAEAAEIRKLYMELTNRVVVQSLQQGNHENDEPESSGLLREAMSSLYATVTLTRDTLKALPAPTQALPENSVNFELSLRSLVNDVLRRFLSRWHPRLKAWEGTGLPESVWPLEPLCRQDLETTRRNALRYVMSLARGLGIADQERRLIELPEEANDPAAPLELLVELAKIKRIEVGMSPSLAAVQAEQSWKVLVELAALVPWLRGGKADALSDDELAALLRALPPLIARLRHEIKRLPPSPWVDPEGDGEALESVLLRVVQHRMQPFAARFAMASSERRAPKTKAERPNLKDSRAAWGEMLPDLYRDVVKIDAMTGGSLILGQAPRAPTPRSASPGGSAPRRYGD